MHSTWIEVAGGRLYLEVGGSGEPLMLLHGWPLDHRMFAPQIEGLREHFTLIAFDRRGFGKSEAQPDLRLELDDIDRILDVLGVPTVHLLGMSQGGRMALRYATTRPERVRSLLLQGAIVDGLIVAGSDADHVPVAEYAELAGKGQLQEVKTRWLQHPMMWLGAEHEHERRLLETIMDDYAGKDLIDYDVESYAYSKNVLDAAANFRKPTLLLTGEKETQTRREHARTLLARMPDCREVIFKDSGHLSNLTEPALFNATVTSFCAGIGAEPALSAGSAFD